MSSWSAFQEEVNKRMNALGEKVGHFARKNPVTRRACWCLLQELAFFKVRGIDKFWTHFLAIVLTTRIMTGQPWRDQITALSNVLRGQYDLVKVPQS